MEVIFLSHQHKDKAIVGPIAHGLKEVFGEENIFFDDWSIQPGQGIIDEMNKGLERCKVFFFFISSNSLDSDMVKMEWQNAIMRESKHNVLFVPIRMTNIEVPALLTQKLYLDMYHNGIDITLKQMVDLVRNGKLTPDEYKPYENIVAYSYVESDYEQKRRKINFYIFAQTFYEPISRFLVCADISQEDGTLNITGGGMVATNYYPNAIPSHPSGNSLNGFYLGRDSGITPGFPLQLIFTVKSDFNTPHTIDLMREVKDKEFRSIPVTQINSLNELPK
ncbi:toll/interleukin-1 receptor domain-containing protein [Rossellomorea sp. NPDC071047]|uniref:toll/interleukin-1 receptor domain-containing protein n=1 Tax=Rossellomorea sp. NPDC071047 TaxID=3390675 RepID=UPI003D049BF7